MKIGMLVVTASLVVGPTTDSPAHRAGTAPTAAVITTGYMPGIAQDAADSLYRAAREAMGKGDYNRAAELFGRVASQYPRSARAGEAMYYQAFSLYRVGGTEKLKSARDVLARLRSAHPDVAKGDAQSLRTRICGELARQGDEACAAEVSETVRSIERAQELAERDAEARNRQAELAERQAELRERQAERASTSTKARSSTSARTASCPGVNDDDDERIAALNALLQMDAERAVPILTKVLERRDDCSAPLRRKAVFLLSQKRSPATADLLLKIARNDPDQETREQAVFWLSQVSDDRAVDMLQEILRNSKEESLQNKALFALSQHRSGRGAAILREFAVREGASEELRGQAIFWLGQRASAENNEFLRNLYSRLTNPELKDKVLFSLSQRRGMGNEKWLMGIVTNERENVELRKKALFWAGQGGIAIEELIPFYARLTDREMKEQMIFVLSQRRSGPAVDKLLDIAKNDRDPEMRKKAIFWLGQSRDPRVQQFLLDLINR